MARTRRQGGLRLRPQRVDKHGIPILDGFTPLEGQAREQMDGGKREPPWTRFAEEGSDGHV